MRNPFRRIFKSPAIFIIAAIPVVVMLPLLPQVPDVMTAAAMKFGSVIDASTGKGIPNAIVIVQPITRQDAFFVNGSGGCIYRYVTRTDAKGDYFIPPKWPSGFGMPLMHSRVYTSIRAFKSGFITEGDEEFIREVSEKTPSAPRSVAKIASTEWRGLWMNVDPMLLEPTQLSLRDEIVYFDGLFKPGAQCFDRGANEPSIRAEIYDTFSSSICNFAPDVQMSLTEARAIMRFGQDINKFYDAMRNMEGMKWNLNPGRAPVSEPSFLAKNLCVALHAAGRPV